MIQKCFEQNRFPERDQSRIQQLLSLPETFFADIHAGRSYEDALRGPQQAEDTGSEALRAALLSVTRILSSDAPPQETEAEMLARWQQHLDNQIKLIDQASFPKMTSEEELRLLAKIESAIKPKQKKREE